MTYKLSYYNYHFIVSSEESYRLLFKLLGKFSAKKLVVFLSGNIGVGKTTFVKYYIKNLNSKKNAYSPTFPFVIILSRISSTLLQYELTLKISSGSIIFII